jgi:hypothetical protein
MSQTWWRGLVLLAAFAALSTSASTAGAQQAPATFLYPTDGATDVDTGIDIQWTPVADALAYYLYVGTTPGAKDLVDSRETSATSFSAWKLPAGRIAYARLWTKFPSTWLYVDIAFETDADAVFAFVHPPAGATADMTLPFEWTPLADAERYYLYVGTSPGAKDVVNTGEIAATTYAASDLPVGTPLYARLWVKIDGVWDYIDQTFEASASTATYARFVHPLDGAADVPLDRMFEWTPVPGAQAYTLHVGTSLGANDLFNTGETQQIKTPVPVLPAGQPTYARLWTKVADRWRSVDITFTAADGAALPLVASFVYPTDGVSDMDLTQPIRWTDLPYAQAYALTIGTTPGARDVFATGETLQTSVPAALPTTGTLYARLYTKVTGVWRSVDIAFAAAPLTATVIAPLDLATDVDLTGTIRWTSVARAEAYYLYIGTTPGAKDLVDSEETLQTSWPLLSGGKSPGMGVVWTTETAYVRLWTKVAGAWRHVDSSFATAPLAAAFLEPTGDSLAYEPRLDFAWTEIGNASAYRLVIEAICLGKRCSKDRGRRHRLWFDSGRTLLTSTSVRLTHRAGTWRARIWTEVAGAWRFREVTFTRSAAAKPPRRVGRGRPR